MDRNNGANVSENKYEALYTELLAKGEGLHENNKKRIRIAFIVMIILPVVLDVIRWITDSDKIVFLIIWVFIMFVVAAYLISIEYIDSQVEEVLREVTDSEEGFDDLLSRPENRRIDLHERIRARIESRRGSRDAAAGSDGMSDAATEAEAVAAEIDELAEAEEAMEELRETAPDEIITALKEAFDKEISRENADEAVREEDVE